MAAASWRRGVGQELFLGLTGAPSRFGRGCCGAVRQSGSCSGADNLAVGLSRPPAADVLLSPQDLYVYISEHEHFTDFNVSSALFWQKRDLVYGDWTSGENADGCYEHYGEVDISQVGCTRCSFWKV